MAKMFESAGLSKEDIIGIANDKGFKKRKRVLCVFDFLYALLATSCKETVSYCTMAATLYADTNKIVSKQALHKAMKGEGFLNFMNEIFEKLLGAKLGSHNAGSKFGFQRIIIQDSTVIKLPKRLGNIYSGVKNGFVQVVNSRIQYAFDALTNCSVYFKIDSYSINDLKSSPLLTIQAGDLVLRDRGYFSQSEIIRILKAKADFIYRYKHGPIYYDVQTGVRLDLKKSLNKKKVTEIKVRIGDQDGPVFRLLAAPTRKEVADQRRAKLKKEASSFPSKEVLALLSWTIFLTSIDEKKADFKDVFHLYKLRWRVEIIFKAMKSHLQLNKIHNVSDYQLRFIIAAKMILFLLFFQFVYNHFNEIVFKKSGKELSLLKLCKYLVANIEKLAILIVKTQNKKLNNKDVIPLIIYCTYDKRKRHNYNQQLYKFA